MKSILISIRPKWCDLIASGEKTIEVRKTRPHLETPFKCYIYCTRNARDLDKLWVLNEQRRQEYGGLTAACANLAERPNCHYCGNGKVIGEFVCDNVFLLHPYTYDGGSADLEQRKLIQTFEGSSNDNEILSATCLSQDEIFDYIGVGNYGYGWHISDLKIYDKPKELSEFTAADKKSIRQCKNREQSYYAFTDTGYIKNGFYCREKDDWCFGGCKRKALTRPPQSWCYVEEV